jgi:hypothetical protein
VSQPGLEVFARSSCANHPWVFDSNGSLDSEGEPTWSWTVGASNTPADWYRGGPENHEGGVDVVTPIRWEASGPEFIAVKERGADPNAKAALLVATNGAFLQPYQGHSIVTLDNQPQRVHRMYVADVAGDYREEVIVVDSNHDCGASVCNGMIRIYWNSKPNPHPDAQPRKWEQQYYRRVKQNWDYYSPS